MSTLKTTFLYLLAFVMVGVGISHFTTPDPYVRIVPSALPSPLALVYISGAFEVLGGIGLLVPRTRKAAAWGLILLYIAVFPANINMAVNEIQMEPGGGIPVWTMWARLPFQLVFIAWAYWFTRPDPTPRTAVSAPSTDPT